MDLEFSKMNVTYFFEILRATCPATQRNIPEDQNPQ